MTMGLRGVVLGRDIHWRSLRSLQPRNALCRKWSEIGKVCKGSIKCLHTVCMSIGEPGYMVTYYISQSVHPASSQMKW